jgi:ribosomal protein L7Ae-like RNA K-turn-binding protein
VLAADASAGQLEKIEGLMRHGTLPARYVPTRAQLGRALGGPPLSAVAVTHPSFAERLGQVLAVASSENENEHE